MTTAHNQTSFSPAIARRFYVEWAWRWRQKGFSREVIREIRARAREFRGARQ